MSSSGSIDGLGIQIAYLELTRQRAAYCGFVNLVSFCTNMIADAEEVRTLTSTQFTRTHIFTRIRVLQERAKRAFERNTDLTSEEETKP